MPIKKNFLEKIPTYRRCYKCKEKKILEDFFHKESNFAGKGHVCKTCKSNQNRKKKVILNRTCERCKELKPFSDFRENVLNIRGRGRDYICLDCDSKQPKINITHRTCYKCKEKKLLEDFRNRSADKFGKDYICKECDKIYRKPKNKKISKIKLPKEIPKERQCYNCKEVKPLETFVNEKNNFTGKGYICKICKNLKKRKTPIEKVIPTNRKCYKCKEVKILEEFERKKNSSLGRGYLCKECKNRSRRVSENPRLTFPLWVHRARERMKDKRKKYDNTVVSSEFLIQLYEEQEGKCYYSNIEMNVIIGKKNPKQISVDRIDSKIGYTENNIVLCCLAMNYCKSDFEETDFLEFIQEFKSI